MSLDPSSVGALYDSTLKPRLDALEHYRLSVRSYIGKSILIMGPPIALFWFSDLFDLALPAGAGIVAAVVGVGLTIAGALYVGTHYLMPGLTAYANYQSRFKREIVAEVFKLVCPTGTYTPDQGISAEVFDRAGIFSTQGQFKSDDRVRGTIGQTPFEAAEIDRHYSSGGKNSTTYYVFHGLFFHLDFNKSLNGVTIVQPEGAPSYQMGDRAGLKKVTLENPEFEKVFAVFASSDVEARYVLTPAMMERVLALQARAEKPIFLGFKGHSAYIGVHYGHPLFEPDMEQTTSRGAVEQMAEHFALAEFVVQELDLNTRIWTKGVDASLLAQPDSQPAGFVELAVAKGGSLTETDLWKSAAAAVGATLGETDDGAPAVRPADTRIKIDHEPTGSTIAYGLPLSFWILVSISIASVVVGASALRSLSRTVGLGPLTTLLGWLPATPFVDAITTSTPIPWLIGAVVIGSLLSLGWITRVRRVAITADAVRISRGLRPFPRSYPRAEYRRVLRVGKAVFIAKGEGFTIVNPSASPMLTDDEARWVAAEMRRAMTQTAGR